jgi:hypothetical protein
LQAGHGKWREASVFRGTAMLKRTVETPQLACVRSAVPIFRKHRPATGIKGVQRLEHRRARGA